MLAPFGVRPKGTVQARILPMAHALAERGHLVRVIVPPWDDPSVGRGEGRSGSAWAASQGALRAASQGALRAASREGGGVAGVHTVTLSLPRRVPDSVALTMGLVGEALWPGRVGSGARGGAERELESFRAEVVHAFKPVGYTGLAGLALAGLRVPWVLDVDDWEGPGGWADVNRYSGTERLSIMAMEALLPRLAGAVTAASKTLEARAWNMGIGRARVSYVPNGVWQDKYASWGERRWESEQGALRAELGVGDGPVVLLYTRFDVFPVRWPLAVMKLVLAEHPAAKLLVIGKGFAGEEEAFREQAGRMGIGDSVVIAGYVWGEKLPAYLSLADVCIYPMRDTLLNRAKSPMKVLEPMVMGLPVVAHRVGEAAQFVGDAGVLVTPGDLGGMASAVSWLLADAERRGRLGERARRRVWEEFNWERLSERVEGAYLTALGR